MTVAPETAAARAAGILHARMTPAQRFAFEYPATDPLAQEDARFNHLVDEQRGDTAWRVTLIIDAKAHQGNPGEENWPHWHCRVTYGEKRNGMARAAAPLFKLQKVAAEWYSDGEWVSAWPNMRWRKAEALIRKELRGVGLPATLAIATRQQLEAGMRARGMAPHQMVGVSGRVKLTVAEAQACLSAEYLKQFTSVMAG